jgi:L-serine kinase (ADP)
MELRFCDPNRLRPTENHDRPAVEALHLKIRSENCWRVPLLVHRGNLAILDGHHRREVALRLGLDYVPCLLVSYDEGTVELSSWRADVVPTYESVIAAALTGELFPIKTTRHRLKTAQSELAIPLGLLGRGAFAANDETVPPMYQATANGHQTSPLL